MALPLTKDFDATTLAPFKALQGQFLSGLPQRLEEIRMAPSLEAQHAALHRLVGSAGSYGFEALGQCAQEAIVLLAAPHTVSARDAILQRLENHVRHALGASPPPHRKHA